MELLFNQTDCRKSGEDETYNNKFVLIHPDFFKPQFRSAKYQLFYAVGGFGCDPTKMGNAVFGADCEEEYRQERYNIMGFASEESIKKWEDTYGMSREVLIERTKV